MLEIEIDDIKFSGSFDSGNLARVEKKVSKKIRGFEEFHLWTRKDCEGTEYERKSSTWFHFWVKGAKKNQIFKFTIFGMNNQRKLYKNGMRPVVKSLPSRPLWERVKSECSIPHQEEDEFFISFTFKFEFGEEKTFFSFCYPFSYSECQDNLSMIDQRLKGSPRIYWKRELLTYSIEGRRIDLLTVSSYKGIDKSNFEEHIEGSFPDSDSTRPNLFNNKKIILITARVHPGETPSSYIFNGFLEFILNDNDPRAQQLRDTFVFKLIPMLNPDGVYHGHYRTDVRGENLNRVYANPDQKFHPSIFSLKKLVMLYSKMQVFSFFIDLHGHASKRGCFIFGNYLKNVEDQISNVLFAKLVSLNTQHFDFSACNFSERSMFSKDREGQTRLGTSRVAIHMGTGITNCYTLECNYNTGKSVNTLHPISQSTASSSVYCKSNVNKIYKHPPKYNPEIFNEIGKAIAISVLDFFDMNPLSRIPSTRYQSIHILKNWIRKYIMKNSTKTNEDAEEHSPNQSKSDAESAAVFVQFKEKTLNVKNKKLFDSKKL